MKKLFAAIGAELSGHQGHIRISVPNEPESLRRLRLAIRKYRREVLHLAESAELSRRNIEDIVWYTLLKAGYVPDSGQASQFIGADKAGDAVAYCLEVRVIDAPLRMRSLIAHLNDSTN